MLGNSLYLVSLAVYYLPPFRRRNNLREQQQVLQRQQLQRQLQQQQDLRRQLSQGVEQPRVLQRPVANPAAAVPLPVDAAAVEVAREVQDILRSGGGAEAAEEDVSEQFPGSRELLRWLLSSNFDPRHFR